MFRFLLRLLHLNKKKHPSAEDKKAKNNPGVASRPSTAYHILLLGGLTMLLISMIYGGIYGAFFMENLHEEEDNQNVMDYAGVEKADGETQEQEGQQDQEDQGDDSEAIIRAFRSSHSHLSLFALIAVAVAGNLNNMRLKEKLNAATAMVFLTGAILFPAGIIIQPLFNETFGKFLSVFGGSLVILSTALYIWGSIKTLKK